MMKVLRSEDYEDLQSLRRDMGWDFWADGGPVQEVRDIISQVERDGDRALRELTKRLDGIDLPAGGLRVGESEMRQAREKVDPSFIDALRGAARSITSFHRRQSWESLFWDTEEGARIGQMIRPLKRVGVYIPGGRASYPSTALMTIIPAKVAGVHEIAVCVPPGRGGEVNPYTLLTLDHLGVKEVYRVGGAQAIAALALGTETIAPVEKVVGPGNIYVTLAKKEVFGRVGIDMLAGPSELVVLADGKAEADLLAWEMAAQLEHGGGARACLITDSEGIVTRVQKALVRRIEAEAGGPADVTAVMVRDMAEGARLVDVLAPEHLVIDTEDMTGTLSAIHNAGAIFLGSESPVALGDYAVGVNHVLPTKGGARYASPLGVYDFLKRTNIVLSNPRANRHLGPLVETLARVEGLVNHAEAMRHRLYGQEEE
ncbi:MAG: histidinol dehydrogenase [Actinobacteria bacterium]|nr:histidinol dehydrogenase [Actinomycetota bacterium]